VHFQDFIETFVAVMFIAQRGFRPLENNVLKVYGLADRPLTRWPCDISQLYKTLRFRTFCGAASLLRKRPGSESSGEDNCGINILPLWIGHSDWPLLTKLLYRILKTDDCGQIYHAFCRYRFDSRAWTLLPETG